MLIWLVQSDSGQCLVQCFLISVLKCWKICRFLWCIGCVVIELVERCSRLIMIRWVSVSSICWWLGWLVIDLLCNCLKSSVRCVVFLVVLFFRLFSVMQVGVICGLGVRFGLVLVRFYISCWCMVSIWLLVFVLVMKVCGMVGGVRKNIGFDFRYWCLLRQICIVLFFMQCIWKKWLCWCIGML